MPFAPATHPSAVRIGGAVAAGGAAGSALRYAVTVWLPDDPVGVGVIAANLMGAFLLGLAVGRTSGHMAVAFWRVGLLGSFTTFSTLMVQTVALPAAAAAAYMVGQLLLGVALAAVGLRLAGGVLGTTITRDAAAPPGGAAP